MAGRERVKSEGRRQPGTGAPQRNRQDFKGGGIGRARFHSSLFRREAARLLEIDGGGRMGIVVSGKRRKAEIFGQGRGQIKQTKWYIGNLCVICDLVGG